MCGIAGSVSLDGSPARTRVVEKMIGMLAHRGPDGEAVWSCEATALAHRRLAIIDLTDGGRQPMSYRDRFTITFNGEIYNYPELRDELALLGHRFMSASDTEVLLAAYSEWGTGCLDRLDGMFSFAIWDALKSELFCARDRFGEKPFFYAEANGHFYFASEMKALFSAAVKPALNAGMLYMYLRHDVVQHPDTPEKTFYAPARILPPAHFMVVKRGGQLKPTRYWTVPRASTLLSFEEQCEDFKKRLTLSVERRLRSDVTVGTSLSGGLDSTTVVSLVSRLSSKDRHSFSARFHDAALDEGRYIDIAEKATGCIRHDVFPNADTLADEWQKLFYHQEEPFTTASIFAQWEVMKTAKQHGVTVLLDGQGADETLAGYSHFFRPFLKDVWRHQGGAECARQRTFLRANYSVDELRASEKAQALFPRTWSLLGKMRSLNAPSDLPAFVHNDWHQTHSRSPTPFRHFATLDESLRFFTLDHGLKTLLRFADRSSMAFSREVRLPFLSHELVEFIFATPTSSKIWNGSTKRLLREGMRGVVPEPILQRHDKRGLDTPQRMWLQNPKVTELVRAAHKRTTAEGLTEGTCPAAPEDQWKILCAAAAFEFVAGFSAMIPL